jgi:hypothetical protein
VFADMKNAYAPNTIPASDRVAIMRPAVVYGIMSKIATPTMINPIIHQYDAISHDHNLVNPTHMFLPHSNDATNLQTD